MADEFEREDASAAGLSENPQDSINSSFGNVPQNGGNSGFGNAPQDSRNVGFGNAPQNGGNSGFGNAPQDSRNVGFGNAPQDGRNGGFGNAPQDGRNGGFGNLPYGSVNGGFGNPPYGSVNGGFGNPPYGGMHGGYYGYPPYGGYPQPNMPFEYQNLPASKNPPAGNKGLKAFLWVMFSVVMLGVVGLGVWIVLSASGDNIAEESSSGSGMTPYHGDTDSSYSTDTSLPDAPQASADINGPQISTSEISGTEGDTAASRAYKKASPSVVCITCFTAGSDYVLTQDSSGSGIVISADGYIATNSHVVNDSKNTGVMVTLSNGEQYLGTIIGIDTKTDLAVIKIDANNLTPAEFCNSDSVYVGQNAYALGNPGGSKFSNSLTSGTISAVNRLLSVSSYVRYIQTDAAINPGNSGGALINDDGQIIGINTAKLVGTDYEGMGFAIPSNKVAEIVNLLIKYGYVNNRGTLGITCKECSLYESKSRNVPQGMIITNINDESPLADTNVLVNDIIIGVNGTTITGFSDYVDIVDEFLPGDTVTLTIFRTSTKSSSHAYTFDVDVVLMEDTGE